MAAYHPEPYWSDVAKRIKSRKGKNVIAGDDEPYYRYKRDRFLSLLLETDCSGKHILEIGSGPGGNLKALLTKKPASLTGADISAEMIDLARSHLPAEVNLVKVDGTHLPFEDQSFDFVFSATVLQHNTDEAMVVKLIGEMCRVAKDSVFIFESIDEKLSGDELCHWRPVSMYEKWFTQHGFGLHAKKFINIRVSYFVSGAIRKGLNPKKRAEGEPLNRLSVFLQSITLPFTRLLDKMFVSEKDVARLEFVRTVKTR